MHLEIECITIEYIPSFFLFYLNVLIRMVDQIPRQMEFVKIDHSQV